MKRKMLEVLTEKKRHYRIIITVMINNYCNLQFKSIPQPTGEATYVATPGGVYQTVPRLSTPAAVKAVTTTPPTPVVSYTPQVVLQRSSGPVSKKQKESEVVLTCDTCGSSGTLANLVQ